MMDSRSRRWSILLASARTSALPWSSRRSNSSSDSESEDASFCATTSKSSTLPLVVAEEILPDARRIFLARLGPSSSSSLSSFSLSLRDNSSLDAVISLDERFFDVGFSTWAFSPPTSSSSSSFSSSPSSSSPSPPSSSSLRRLGSSNTEFLYHCSAMALLPLATPTLLLSKVLMSPAPSSTSSSSSSLGNCKTSSSSPSPFSPFDAPPPSSSSLSSSSPDIPRRFLFSLAAAARTPLRSKYSL
mmetsp:Transcript_3206/g.5291  ORF Transcript_3206/g.5291 Transcript_3206/m.5291 type:complete len:244 (+) Transcript_3206:672-1403(+)